MVMTSPKRRWARREWLQLAGVIATGYGISVIVRSNAPPGRDVSGNSTARALRLDPGGPAEGPASADLRVIAFTDYLCPACREAAPALAAAVEEDGNVQVIYKDWPIFGEVSERLARVALAADHQGIYARVHHALMSETPSADPAILRGLVERAGGRWARIEQDLREHGGEIEAALDKNRRDAFALGIAGTPTYLTGSILIEGPLSRSGFIRAFGKARDK